MLISASSTGDVLDTVRNFPFIHTMMYLKFQLSYGVRPLLRWYFRGYCMAAQLSHKASNRSTFPAGVEDYRAKIGTALAREPRHFDEAMALLRIQPWILGTEKDATIARSRVATGRLTRMGSKVSQLMQRRITRNNHRQRPFTHG